MTAGGPRSSVKHAAIWAMAAQYLAFAAQFVMNVVVSRYFLTPGEVGLFGIALAASMLVAILQDFGITRFIAGEADLDATKIRTCYSISVVFAAGVGLVILALSWPLSHAYADARLLPLLAIIAASYLLTPFGIVPVALLQRRMDFRSIFIVTVGTALVTNGCVLALAAAGWSAQALAWGTVAQAAARGLLGQWRSGERFRLPLRFAGARPVIGFGGTASVLYMTGALSNRTPELIIGATLSTTAVGLFGRANGLAGALLQLVSGAIGQVFFPAFARLRDEGTPFAPAYARVVAGYTSTTWPAMAFLAAAALPLVSSLYGPRWAAVAPALVWIALSELPFVALPLHMDIPIVSGKIRTLLRYNVIDTLASVALLVVGCRWGTEGAAASRLAYALVWYGIYARFMRGLIGFRFRDLLVIYAKSGCATVATVAPLLIAFRILPPGSIGFGLLAGCAAVGCVGWLVAMKLARHPNLAELDDVVRALRALRPARVAR